MVKNIKSLVACRKTAREFDKEFLGYLPIHQDLEVQQIKVIL